MDTAQSKAIEKLGDAFEGFAEKHNRLTTENRSRIEKLEAQASLPPCKSNGPDYTTTNQYLKDVIERKAVTVGTATAGGNAAPEELSRMIQAQIHRYSPMMDLVQIEESQSGDYAKIVTDLGHSSGWVGEGGTRSETDTALIQKVEPTVGTVYSYPKASEESLQDVFFNLTDWFVEESSRGFAKVLGEAIVNGDGSDKPTGFLQASTSSTPDFGASPERPFGTVEYVPTGAAAGFQQDRLGSPQGLPGDVLFDAFFALNEFHRASATWVMNSATFATVRKWKDGDGNYLWERNFGDNPATLLGRPVRIVEGMSDIGANAYPIAVADWKAAYILANVGPLRVTVDDNITTPGYLKLYARQRVAGKVLDSAALKLVKCATS